MDISFILCYDVVYGNVMVSLCVHLLTVAVRAVCLRKRSRNPKIKEEKLKWLEK